MSGTFLNGISLCFLVAFRVSTMKGIEAQSSERMRRKKEKDSERPLSFPDGLQRVLSSATAMGRRLSAVRFVQESHSIEKRLQSRIPETSVAVRWATTTEAVPRRKISLNRGSSCAEICFRIWCSNSAERANPSERMRTAHSSGLSPITRPARRTVVEQKK